MRLPRLPPRAALVVLVVVSAAAAVSYVICPARLTVSNAGLTVDCARGHALVVGAAALALIGAGLFTLDRRVRVTGGVLALIALAGTVELLSYRIGAGRDALSVRRALVRKTLPWGDIARSRPEGDALAISDTRGGSLRVDLARLSPEQRSALERVMARRIWESSEAVR